MRIEVGTSCLARAPAALCWRLFVHEPNRLTAISSRVHPLGASVGDHRWQVKVTQIDCNVYRPVDWRRGYTKLLSSPLWNPHPLGGAKLPLPLPLALGGSKYSTTLASGFQAMSQTASALAYELLKPQLTPRAPMGCLQYFTPASGIIESFNFGQYLNGLDYSICIQRQPEACRLVFTSTDYDWSIAGVGVPGASSGVGDQDCARDYLLIPGASRSGDGFTYDRFCGGRLHYFRGQTLSAPVVIKSLGPVVLRFHSDAHFEPLNSGGFRLQYDQSAQDCVQHSAEESGSLASQQLLAGSLSDSRPLGLVEQAPVLYAAQHESARPQLELASAKLDAPAKRSDWAPADHWWAWLPRPTNSSGWLAELAKAFELQPASARQARRPSLFGRLPIGAQLSGEARGNSRRLQSRH